MDRILYLAILVALGVFCIYKMFRPPQGQHYRLKSIDFTPLRGKITPTHELGNHIYTAIGKRRFLLPTEIDMWTEVLLYENGIVLKHNKREKRLYFGQIHAIVPILVNSLFVKGKYYAYSIELGDNNKYILKSSEINGLDILIDNIVSLFPPEREVCVVTNVYYNNK